MSTIPESRNVLAEAYYNASDVREDAKDDYLMPGESGVSQFYAVTPRHIVLQPGEDREEVASRYGDDFNIISLEETQYFDPMDDEIPVEDLAELLPSTSEFRGSFVADYLDEDVETELELVADRTEAFLPLSIFDDRLHTGLTHPRYPDTEYSVWELIDLKTDGAVLVDARGFIYPFTVELRPEPEMKGANSYPEGAGTKTRSGIDITEASLSREEDEFFERELDAMDRFLDGERGRIKSSVEGDRDVWLEEPRYGDIATVVLSQETARMYVFSQGKCIKEVEGLQREEGLADVVEEIRQYDGEGLEIREKPEPLGEPDPLEQASPRAQARSPAAGD